MRTVPPSHCLQIPLELWPGIWHLQRFHFDRGGARGAILGLARRSSQPRNYKSIPSPQVHDIKHLEVEF
jgi:hypothetical protein